MLIFGRWWLRRATALTVAAWLVFVGYVLLAVFSMASWPVSGRVMFGALPLSFVLLFTGWSFAVGFRAPPALREAIKLQRDRRRAQ